MDRNECPSVWWCAMGDASSAIDILIKEWTGSRRKADRIAGQKLQIVADMIWAARSPAPKNYQESHDMGSAMIARVRTALAQEPRP